MLSRAVFITQVKPHQATGSRWLSLVDVRREQARELSLAGVVVCLDDGVIYALEGAPSGLDAFMDVLRGSRCETSVQAPWRASAKYRRHRILALSNPRLEADERERLQEALATGAEDYETATIILSQATTRSTLLVYPAPLTAAPCVLARPT